MNRFNKYIFLLLLVNIMTGVNAAEHAIILQYHHVASDTPPSTSTRPDLFQWQINYLAENGYQVLPLTQVIDSIKNKKTLPAKSVVITFDDSYRSIYSTAFPLLKQNNWPFALFIDTAGVKKNSMHLTWDEIREMKSHGAEVFNHSHSHTHFVRQRNNESKALWLDRIRKEIDLAQSIIEQETGSRDKIIAYPFGEYSLEIINLIKDMGYIGVGQHSGPYGYDMPDSIIPRYPMGANFGKASSFKQKLNTLPLPIVRYPEIEPIQLNNQKPVLKLAFQLNNKKQKHQLKKNFQCYMGGERTQLTWEQDGQLVSVSAQSKTAIPIARSRYNCTLPVSIYQPNLLKREDVNHQTYYWYSQLWIKPKRYTPDHKIDWYQE